MINSVILMGRITKDIELKEVSSGISVCKFSVAVERKFKDKQSNERVTDFIDCQAWRGTANFIARYFQKGSMIAIEGELQNNNWTDQNGNKRYSYIVQVSQAHFCGGKSESAQTASDQTASDQTDIDKFAQAVETAEVLPDQDVPF